MSTSVLLVTTGVPSLLVGHSVSSHSSLLLSRKSEAVAGKAVFVSLVVFKNIDGKLHSSKLFLVFLHGFLIFFLKSVQFTLCTTVQARLFF